MGELQSCLSPSIHFHGNLLARLWLHFPHSIRAGGAAPPQEPVGRIHFSLLSATGDPIPLGPHEPGLSPCAVDTCGATAGTCLPSPVFAAFPFGWSREVT